MIRTCTLVRNISSKLEPKVCKSTVSQIKSQKSSALCGTRATHMATHGPPHTARDHTARCTRHTITLRAVPIIFEFIFTETTTPDLVCMVVCVSIPRVSESSLRPTTARSTSSSLNNVEKHAYAYCMAQYVLYERPPGLSWPGMGRTRWPEAA
jgi:hypothetical protein